MISQWILGLLLVIIELQGGFGNFQIYRVSKSYQKCNIKKYNTIPAEGWSVDRTISNVRISDSWSLLKSDNRNVDGYYYFICCVYIILNDKNIEKTHSS